MRTADATLLTAEASFGSVDAGGSTATLMVDGAVRLKDGGDYRLIRQSVPLVRVSDNWAMRHGTLLSLMNLEGAATRRHRHVLSPAKPGKARCLAKKPLPCGRTTSHRKGAMP